MIYVYNGSLQFGCIFEKDCYLIQTDIQKPVIYKPIFLQVMLLVWLQINLVKIWGIWVQEIPVEVGLCSFKKLKLFTAMESVLDIFIFQFRGWDMFVVLLCRLCLLEPLYRINDYALVLPLVFYSVAIIFYQERYMFQYCHLIQELSLYATI